MRQTKNNVSMETICTAELKNVTDVRLYIWLYTSLDYTNDEQKLNMIIDNGIGASNMAGFSCICDDAHDKVKSRFLL